MGLTRSFIKFSAMGSRLLNSADYENSAHVTCPLWNCRNCCEMQSFTRKDSHLPFFKPLSKTAPGFDWSQQRWPISGQVYVAMFMGPISGGLFGGIFAPHFGAMGIGLVVGLGVSFINALLFDRFVDSWVARNRKVFQRGMTSLLANVAGFSWAVLLSAVAMLAPFAAFGIFPLAQ